LCPSNTPYNSNEWQLLFNQVEEKLFNELEFINSVNIIKADNYNTKYNVKKIFDPIRDKMGHVPYTTEYYNMLGTLIKRRFYQLKNKPYKVIVLDCDNTLWQGICGEVGAKGVTIEEPYAKFHEFLIKQNQQGVLLCLCSKNVPEDVWKVFDENKGMKLAKEHITDSKINWLPKSQNIKELAKTLNLGLDSFIFIDDNPVECGEVRANCPEALTIQWPDFPHEKLQLINHLWVLDHYIITKEDKMRTKLYQANVARVQLQEESNNFRDFINSLNLKVEIKAMIKDNLPRVSQLTQRTNQFNFTTIRRKLQEVEELVNNGYECLTVEVEDRFGAYGLVGVMIFKKEKTTLVVDTFLLSCRVLGRGVEHKMMSKLGEIGKELSLENVNIRFNETAKNLPAKKFLEEILEQCNVKMDLANTIVPSVALSKISMKTAKDSIGIHKKPKVDYTRNNELTVSIRDKEILLGRIYKNLSDVTDLTKEINEFLNLQTIEEKTDNEVAISINNESNSYDIYKQVLEELKLLFSKHLEIPVEDIDSNDELEQYNIDSFKIMDIIVGLNNEYEGIPSTLLFEHRNLESIAEFLVENYKDRLDEKYPNVRNDDNCTKKDVININKEDKLIKHKLFNECLDKVEDIAIIGVNGLYPNAKNIGELWDILVKGGSSISEIPKNRWDISKIYDPTGNKVDKSYSKWGAFIKDIDRFEPSFFNISPRETELMDPQQRLFLQVVWGLIEDAGYTVDSIDRDTSVFAAVVASDYGTYVDQAALKGVSAYRDTDFYQIPNRISYFFNFNGPSMAINTACSSSGTAVHLAYESLCKRECNTAIVGGINLFIHPSRWIQYSRIRFHSPDGICRAFGEGANGTVFGEGVGAVLLKRLSDAKRDNDNIYGIIKGSAINSGGKTNGFTVPNPRAQAELISKALKNGKVDPRTISYVEAHGTGTSLGDPIEVRGLDMAFQENIKDSEQLHQPFCAIGSIKPNIGHSESASALSGMIKVLLQMKYNTLVPSLNAKELNPQIPFDKSYFYIQQKIEKWKRPIIEENGEQTIYPLRAGLSSFGAGGSNSHIILEEYSETNSVDDNNNTQIVILSSKDEKRLKNLVNSLIVFLEDNLVSPSLVKDGNKNITLEQIAYTLQVGRKSMEERVAFVVSNIEQLINKLKEYAGGKRNNKNIFSGNIKTPRKLLKDLYEDMEDSFVELLISQGKLTKLAQMWILGVDIKWDTVYQYKNPKRVSLPGYQFEGERFWIPEYNIDEQIVVSKNSRLHPMIEKNTSTLDVQKFTSTFSGKEFFFEDHIIQGKKILPGVAYIEMAREAGRLSGLNNIVKIQDIVWLRPIKIVDKSCEVSIRLYPVNNCVEYEVNAYENNHIIHGQGKLITCNEECKVYNEIIDLQAIKERCKNQINSVDYYKSYEEAGFEYGITFKPIQRTYVGENEALVYLEFPQTRKTKLEDLQLHSTLMDGALQSVGAFVYDENDNIYLPFALGEVEIIKELKEKCYAHATLATNTQKIKTYNIDIIDENGSLLIRIKDYSLRAMSSNDYRSKLDSEIIYYTNKWKESINNNQEVSVNSIVVFGEHKDLLNNIINDYNAVLVKRGTGYKKINSNNYEINPLNDNDYINLIKDLKENVMPSHILHLWSNNNIEISLEEKTLESVFSVSYLSKALIKEKIGKHINLVYGYSLDVKENIPYYESISALLKSVCLENSKISYKTLGFNKFREFSNNLISELKSNDTEVRYKDEKRYIKTINEVELLKRDNQNLLIKDKGVYIITGGTGGLGLIFAKYFAKEYSAKLILTGRSNLNSDKKKKIEYLKKYSSEINYVKANITNKKDVQSLIAIAKEKYNKINGIIHSAGVIKDAYLINKTKEDIQTVLAPKVKGTTLIDEVTKNEKLDFFVMFSSISGVLGNVGQIDYSYANCFMDNFAIQRNKMVEDGERHGKSVAINWPLWRDGGMNIDEQSKIMIEKAYGMKLFETEIGVKTFKLALSEDIPQLMVMQGNKRKINSYICKSTSNKRIEEKTKSTLHNNNFDFFVYIEKDLVDIVSKILKINKTNISIDEDMSYFGFDSISFTEFGNMLNDKYNLHIMPSIFYEHSTLVSLAQYLGKEFSQNISSYYRTKEENVINNIIYKSEENSSKINSNNKHGEKLFEELSNGLKYIISDILKISRYDIDLDEDISSFGFDSISFTEFSNKLNEKYNLHIMPSIFYEHSSIISLVDYMLDEYKEILMSYYEKSKDSTSIGSINEEVKRCNEVTNIRPINRFRKISEGSTISDEKLANSTKNEPIAIIGVSAVMPGSKNVQELWNNLMDGENLISEVPIDRWDAKSIYGDPMREANKTNIKFGGFIEDGDKFDAKFFCISPREAELMDPQQRVFLETVWKTIEDAGYKSKDISGTKTGIFVGVATSEYSDLLKENEVEILAQTSTGKVHSILANRVSYLLNLNGPSEPIDTACSSALTAVHRAVEEIHLGNCNMAIAGGVNILASPDNFISFSKAGMLSIDGKCKTFDKDANGYVRGEGSGAVLLKPLSKAVEDGDHIYGLIKGSAVNHGGHVNSLTTPNPKAQAEVIINAWNKAKIDPTTIGYIETHGTGTSLGDPIEINGLKKAFNKMYKDWGKAIDKKPHCGLGSVKTNIGHLETAAGIAGLIKALLAINYKKIPKNINFNEINPYIKLEDSPFYLVNDIKEWECDGPRRAGVSSFGFGGTNAHIAIEEYIEESNIDSKYYEEPEIIILSAKNEDRLKEYASNLLKYINSRNKYSNDSCNYEGSLINRLKGDIIEIAADVINVSINDISICETLDEYGFDPVDISKLYNSIIDKYSVQESFFLSNKYLTIECIIEYLCNNYKDQLLEYYPNTYIENSEVVENDNNLSGIAYTLQVGRNEMPQRLAFIATNINDLKEKLQSYIQNIELENIYVGSQNNNKYKTINFIEGEEGKEFLNALIKNKKLEKIAQIWVAGGNIDWNRIHNKRKIKRISLPTYPFARDRYWIPEQREKSVKTLNNKSNSSKLHPLIDRNISTLLEQKFQTLFSGEEFFLADHIIQGKKLLPGVTYIEMARKAAELSGLNNIVKIRDIVWTRPIIVNDSSCEVNISLIPAEHSLDYEVATTDGNTSKLNGQGRIIVSDYEVAKDTIDIKSIKDRCTKEITKEDYYRRYIECGYEYGHCFRTVSKVYVGQNEALAKLALPNNLNHTFEEIVLHPSIMDGALHTIASLRDNNDTTTYLPFSIGELEILNKLEKDCYAYTTLISNNKSIKKYNIDIVDEKGNILIKMVDFSLRALGESNNRQPQTIYYTNEWKQSDAILEKGSLENVLIFEQENISKYIDSKEAVVIKKGKKFKEITSKEYEINPSQHNDYIKLLQVLQQKNINISNIIHLWNIEVHKDNINYKLHTGIYSIYHISKAIIESKLNHTIKIIYGYGNEPYYEAVNSFLKTVSMENTKITYKTIGFNTEENLEIASKVMKELRVEDKYVMYLNGTRYTKELVQAEELQIDNIPLKNNGIYIITGGTGGLGFIFASYIAKNYASKIILTGRSDLTNNKKEKIKELNDFGAEVIYLKADISKKEDVEMLIAKVKERYSSINGIIHSAGILRDSYLINKSSEEMNDVLAAKVYGTVWLDEVTKYEKLDLFVMFSSITATLGNAGQVDYAYANSFMDCFAHKRNSMVIDNKRTGKTVSINWPLWRDGGMQVDNQTEIMLEKNFGMSLLETESGINAFEQSLVNSATQFMVVYGDKNKIDYIINKNRIDQHEQVTVKTLKIDEKKLLNKIEIDLKEIISNILKLDINDIDINEDMSSFGFDSITFTEFSNKLNVKYNIYIIPAIFYEHTTLTSFIAYLFNNYKNVFSDYYRNAVTNVEEDKIEEEIIGAPNTIEKSIRPRFMKKIVPVKSTNNEIYEPIAIVGVSGVMPGSKDLVEFWDNIKEGKDLIREVPKDRWDWESYYGDPTREYNKTNVKWGGFLKEVDKFDPLFFGISPKEAVLMDPQQRIFLELVWSSIEDAGYKPSDISETKTGVFVGVGSTDYKDVIKEKRVDIEAQISTGTAHSVLANRVSYLLNLKGPSEAIDTACSSSLVALHRAIESIQLGNCEMAIAGGVQVIASPDSYIAFSKAGMLCEDGRCKTFDKRANGYVRGEGCGVVVLKPLNKAVEDNDNIYGVIKGSAINHGGHVNTLTTPNPNAQAELIVNAWEKSQIDPTTITYIEAHGTGTSLGDPIEINGLKKAFNQLYKDWDKTIPSVPCCGVGSVKTNIGHLEIAAGIAGIIKVILAMKNKKIPASINFEEQNPYIQLEGSPFYIVDKTIEWRALKDKEGKVIPRRAGISSFGFGGVNAHIVLEEYEDNYLHNNFKSKEPYIIVLSAKNKDRLKDYAKSIVDYIDKAKDANSNYISMGNIEYTLQVGREEMEERISLIVSKIDELRNKLHSYCNDIDNIDNVYYGNIKDKQKIDLLFDGEKRNDYVTSIIKDKEYNRLAKLWVSGIKVEWSLLHNNRKGRRISLPTYPFAREKYWVNDSTKINKNNLNIRKLHPLIDSNTSNFYEQKFTTRFTGDEFYLKHHIVNGKKMLPGVAYLEMANVAGKFSLNKNITIIKDVLWSNPIIVEEQKDVHICLQSDGRDIDYEVISISDDNTRILYSQGTLVTNIDDVNLEYMNIELIKARCEIVKDSEDYYEIFSDSGLEYGDSFKAIKQVYSGEIEVLTRIELPNDLVNNFEKFGLHPSLMDGALQSVIGIKASKLEGKVAHLPLGMEEVIIYKPLSKRCYVHANIVSTETESNIKKYNINILDEKGLVLVRMKGFVVKAIQTEPINHSKEDIINKREDIKYNTKTIESKSLDSSSDLINNVQQKLKNIISKEINLEESRMDILEPFEKYGIDSIMITSLNRVFENHFGQLSKTLLFEYKNIKELAQYFAKNHKDQFVEEQQKATQNKYKKNEKVSTYLEKEEKTIINNRFINAFNNIKTNYIIKDDIAIIGVSGRYPMSNTILEYWTNLKQGKDCITEVPKDRWNHDEYFHPDKNMKGKSYSKWGGFIDHVDKFDPLFFNISPKEAEIMGPQERIFLETVWHTIEDAGYTKYRLQQDTVGVFAGVMYNHYTMYAAEECLKGNVIAVNSTYASIANRVSYNLNLTGPSIALDTMCSSSTTAIHLACESIKRGECEAAIAGGVNVTIHPNKYIMLSQGRFASSDGRCRSFGEGGDGYVPGEGVGAVLLKPLNKAIEDGDRIYAVIKGTSLNHGGKTNGYSVPNPNAQGDLILEALKNARVNPRTISCIEAHGTGTSLGDPIEITGLQKAFSEYTDDKQFCSIGSSKSNIGHLESASGIAAITKVILQMKYKSLVPSIHSEVLNPNINFTNSPFYVQQELTDWKRLEVNGKEYPRRAGVSSFGAGGANAHIVMEEYIDNSFNVNTNNNESKLIVLSARDEERLLEYAININKYIKEYNEEISLLDDIAYTLQVGREGMEERLALIVVSIDELIDKLEQFIKGEKTNANMFRGSLKSRKTYEKETNNINKVKELFIQNKYNELAKIWIQGEDINWLELYSNNKKNKIISLPVYPFARERYWIPNQNTKDTLSSNNSTYKMLHPLIGINMSTVNEQKFMTTFTGKEFFFEDHIVKGKKMLPAAAYIEMTRAAGDLSEDKKVTMIKDILLARPITIESEPKDIQIGLYPDEEFIEYEVSEIKESGITTIYSTGKLIYEDIKFNDEFVDIEDLINECDELISGKECYEKYNNLGIEYGESFRVIDELYLTENKSIAKFTIKNSEEEFKLHPLILDGMLQSVIGFSYSSNQESLYLPFSIGEIVILQSFRGMQDGYIVTKLEESNEDSRVYNIELVDKHGCILLKINDFTVKSFDKKNNSVNKEGVTDSNESVLKELLYKVYNGEIDVDNVIKLMEELK
jgi:FkbH-like protein